MISGRLWLAIGIFFGFLFVALGAFATHALQSILPEKNLTWIATANTYLGYHAFALIALGLWSHWEKWAPNFLSGIFFFLGTILFSGSLYALAFTEIKFFVFLTPVGGSFFLLGWLFFGFSVLKTRNTLV